MEEYNAISCFRYHLTDGSTSQRDILRLGNGREDPLRPTIEALVDGVRESDERALLLINGTAFAVRLVLMIGSARSR